MEKMGFEESFDVIAERIKRRETEKILKREAERQIEVERRRGEKEQATATNEQLGYFTQTFNEKREEIVNALEAASSGSVDKSQLPVHFDKIVKDLQSLQNYVSASSYFLRVYDIRKSQENLQILNQQCQELEEQMLPKKKFGFKTRKSALKPKKESFGFKIEDCVDSSRKTPSLSKSVDLSDSITGFMHRSNESLSLKQDSLFKRDVVLSNLENCTVRLLGVAGTLHITALRNCRVACGPVMTSIFVEECTDCTFVLACQQLRVHSTRHCNFYLHVTSRAIIEDSKEVQFGPYKWNYEEIDLHFQLAGLDRNRNNWDLVDDFNWLASDKPSPHWHVMKENEQSLDWL